MENDNTKESRLSRINQIANKYPDPDSAEGVRYREQIKFLDKKQKEMLKKDGREFEAIFLATLENGAGNVADQVLRNFYREYMNTISFFGLTGLKRLPDSINIMEAFFDYDIIFRVRPELDYLISIEDFFDYVTSSDSPNIDLSSACKMKEGYIYNYTAYDDPKSCMFTMNDGHDYAICGLSMIRREDELSIMLVAGKAYTEDDKNKTINMAKKFLNFKSMKSADKEYAEITNFDNIEWDIEQPSNANGLWQHTVLIRFNLKEKNYSERYVLINLNKSSYYVKDDDTFSLEKQNSNINIKSSFNINNYTTLFEIAKTCVLMPSYIDYRFTFIKPENRQTKLINNLSKSPKTKKLIKSLPEKYCILVRKISAIRVINTGSSIPVGRAYTPPKFQINVSGFWRYYVNKEWDGHDENGNMIKGKTWVKSHLRYKDGVPTEEAPKIVYIKSSISNARRKLEKYREQQSNIKSNTKNKITASENINSIPAYLYVFRSPAHGRDIYKVGYTERDPEIRAQELSSSSGSPVRFLVVQAWAVNDGRAAEEAAHGALSNYRLASNREFFIGKYAELREKIEIAIDNFLIR